MSTNDQHNVFYTGTRSYESFLEGVQPLIKLVESIKGFELAPALQKEGITSAILEDLLLGRIQHPSPDANYPETHEFDKRFYDTVARDGWRPIKRVEEGVNVPGNFHSYLTWEQKLLYNLRMSGGDQHPSRFFEDLETAKKQAGFEDEKYRQVHRVLSSFARGGYTLGDIKTAMELVGLSTVPDFLDEQRALYANRPADFRQLEFSRLKKLYPFVYEKLCFEQDRLAESVFKEMLSKGYPNIPSML